MAQLSEQQLKRKTIEFRKSIINKEKELLDLLPEAFAVVKEAAKRVTGKRLYDVQLIAGFVLNNGEIAEIKAGEGKSIIASLPAYLNALDGKGAHIITTNEYLARRDYEQIGKIFKFLGLTVGLIYHNMKVADRKEAYKKDITYGTITEFGFDYLRDNIALFIDDVVQRELNYAIVDEADSILLDEAQTPMIISSKIKDFSKEPYIKANKFVNSLHGITVLKEENKNKKQLEKIEQYDYVTDLTYKTVDLTEKGIEKAEKEYNLYNFYESKNANIINDVKQALLAKEILKCDVDYIIKDKNVYLIDKFTGRIMFGKKFTGGLHQAVEAKEELDISEPARTLAKISTQNYLKMYKKISGMTGTAKTSENEFNSIYFMNVVPIKTNKKNKRKDRSDRFFVTEQEKNEAIVANIIESQKKGQPVLIGTTSIEKSEKLSKQLIQNQLEHQVLNAKEYEKEAGIIKEAGMPYKVTIATNMAGRGTNILLGGTDFNIDNRKKVIDSGGLKVIGTEKHESRRIDEQLRGRSGRQGEIGESVFYISLEDELLQIYGNMKKIEKYKEKYGKKHGEIKSILLKREINQAQKKAENRGMSVRKRLVYYDDILSKQRKIIYRDRRKIFVENIDNIIEDFISFFCQYIFNANSEKAKRMINMIEEFESIKINEKDLKLFKDKIYNRYIKKKKLIGENKFIEIQRYKMLKIIDEEWIIYLEKMEDIEQGIELQMYGKYNPIDKYAVIAKKEFDNLIKNIKLNIITQLLFSVNY